MNTFQNSKNKQTNVSKADLRETQQAMLRDVKEFFQTDSCAQIVGSMNALVEVVLFSEDVQNVTPELRVDIANQLRAATLISKLNESNDR
ncbi:hypothetical protein [Dyadobacter arcticus]|uniref:Formylmethanofuran dehydrogenase subunit B n=1 Tax=Dyadobacter arcticus TaxID=1078754 RepID=A0ABX0UDQ4_9BACT|nr:hypothetical protein [Dyadobacter arcticus]NIJ51136.1 formylmethanofuran dehydrogenase subunit B [Dyadobacter arcticus]